MKIALGLLLPLALAGCAQVREPQGGPKDTQAPKLMSSQPADGSTLFSGKRIVLHFNERVRLDRVADHLLISPPPAKPPTVSISRATDVVIDLNGPLKANTTYTFNIGEAVKDLSEGNPAAGLAFVVSTGPILDSLSVVGRVMEASTGLPVADALVLLHDGRDTGDVRTAPPAYFTRSGPDGRFKLAHLPGGTMVLNALVDRNGNYRYDLPNEEIAFLDGPVHPGDTTAHELRLFLPLAATQFVIGAQVQEERGWRMVFARPAGAIGLRSLDRQGGNLHWWAEWGRDRDTVVFWPSDTTLLGGQRFILSEGGIALDTLTYRPTGPMPFNLKLTAAIDPVTGAARMISSRPVASVDAGRAMLRADTVPVPLEAELDTAQRRTIGIGPASTKGHELALTLFPKAVEATMGGTNDTTKLNFGKPDPRTLGKLKVEVVPDSGLVPPGPFVLQLLGAQDKLIREASGLPLPGSVQWTNLPPGTYGLKLIADRNADGRWTTGSYSPMVQPEHVWRLKDPVVVRAGWSVESIWPLKTRP